MNRLLLAVSVCLMTTGSAIAQTSVYRRVQVQPQAAPQYQTRYIQRVFYIGAPGRQRRVVQTYAQKYIPQYVTQTGRCCPVQTGLVSNSPVNATPVDRMAPTNGELPLPGQGPVIEAPGVTDSAPVDSEPSDAPAPPMEPKQTPAVTDAAMPESKPEQKPEMAPELTPTPETTPEPIPIPEAAAPSQPKAAAATKASTDKPKSKKGKKFISLFDGKTLKGWKKTEFGGEGDVEVEDGVLVLSEGADMTGVHTERKLPKMNYEIEFDAQRIEGSDFFVGLTFPVEKKFCSLIMGGWGGGVCGLSSIDGYDASENPTTSYQQFKKGQWYHVRLRVTKAKIEAWIDKDKIVDQTTTNRDLSVRFEVEASQPLGFASYQTIAGLKNIKLRPVNKPDSPPEKD